MNISVKTAWISLMTFGIGPIRHHGLMKERGGKVMKVIYEPKGRAREYAALACNLYHGCTHGCAYCFVPTMPGFPSAEAFHAKAEPRKLIIEKFSEDLGRLAEKGRSEPVLLCFSCDPYQPIEATEKITRSALSVANYWKHSVSILTKGGKLAERDFDILAQNPRNEFGVTLTCGFGDEHKRWEPFAASTWERIVSLKYAKRCEIKTWVSFEPVLDPHIVYQLIKETYPYIDHYKVGKLNYHPHAKTINWPEFRKRVVEVLEEVGANYYIKKDLREAK
jgi:DNA repair photolyase